MRSTKHDDSGISLRWECSNIAKVQVAAENTKLVRVGICGNRKIVHSAHSDIAYIGRFKTRFADHQISTTWQACVDEKVRSHAQADNEW